MRFCPRLSGYSRTEALRLKRDLADDGFVAVRGRGRAAQYVPVPKLPRGRKGEQRGRE